MIEPTTYANDRDMFILSACIGALFLLWCAYLLLPRSDGRRLRDTGVRYDIAVLGTFCLGIIFGVAGILGMKQDTSHSYAVSGTIARAVQTSSSSSGTANISGITLEGSDSVFMFYAKDGEAEQVKQMHSGEEASFYCDETYAEKHVYSCTFDPDYTISEGASAFFETHQEDSLAAPIH